MSEFFQYRYGNSIRIGVDYRLFNNIFKFFNCTRSGLMRECNYYKLVLLRAETFPNNGDKKLNKVPMVFNYGYLTMDLTLILWIYIDLSFD
jgi:hypothetical protein